MLARSASAAAARAPAPTAAHSGDGILRIEGPLEIRAAIHDALRAARYQILTAQPDGPRPSSTLDDAYHAVREHLERQVSMRTLYQHSTRFCEATKRYVQTVTAHGAQVRTLAELFDRLIIIDDAAAFIPDNAERTTATEIREPSVVRFLTDVFDKAWDRAEPYPFHPVRVADAASEVVPDIRSTIRRLLVEGRSDKEIARRLGVSLRSVQGHISWLRDRYGAHHRFQLGYLMGYEEAGR
ncbi:LuxR C-terminal-related transcriptional regulator [Streptomyces triticagri]|uniref:LuxR C-terminal-related transcriptional regulator n=1 Tax=Streptomyces triticagri TaxID=2293568 RepID=UPI0013143381|nr:LuxR C-terminal-related transcriptional regulator [Streptomyces triticagri]